MAEELWVDQQEVQRRLARFFDQKRRDLTAFGSTVNQTFEAFVYAAVIGWYRDRGWNVTLVHPKNEELKSVRLKFSTRGRPSNYTYARCEKEGEVVQVRHQVRVSTHHYRPTRGAPPANVCLDVSVIRNINLNDLGTNDAVPAAELVTFGEAKHMSAFAELVAGFLGLVHEMDPGRLKRRRLKSRPYVPDHPPPFLYVSGYLYKTAEGIVHTLRRRGYDIDVYTRTQSLLQAFELPTREPSPPAKE